jgi:fructose-1,6-bisphosphatase II / sedoheptulose-1,7-bisphosphatase
LSVIAVAPKGGLLHAPDTYMDKIAIGPGYPEGVIDLDEGAGQNVNALAKAKGVSPEEIGVCVLDRPRHASIIEALRSAGARVHLIGDGDIAGVIHCAKPETGIDMYVGSGGAPEGVLAAAALKCVGGQFQGRLVIRNDVERARAQEAGIEDLKRRYDLNDLVSGAAIFIATGVTSGSLLDGVRISKGEVQTHTLVLNAATGATMELKTRERAH